MSKLYGFGYNGNGQLGIGHLEDTRVPTLCIGIPEHEVITKITGGGNHSAILTETAKVDACGWASTLLLSQEGKVYGIGTSQWNEIDGKKSGEEQELTEIRIHEKITSIACGWRHAVALSDRGNVFGWGWGRYGQLGPSEIKANKKDIRSIQKIELPQKIIQTACGHLHTLFRAQDGTVYGVGSNKYGQLSDEDEKIQITNPRIIYNDSISIDAGWHHTLSLSSARELAGRGRSDHGQTAKDHLVYSIKNFCCGSEHTLAIQEDKLIGWGWDEHGNCATNSDFTKVPVVIDSSSNIFTFGAGCATSWFALV
ncbi:unnamed protein product [Rhizopus stolonifer]